MVLNAIELLGFAAGATTLISSVPQLVANLRTPHLVKGQSIMRNCLQCGGNLLWLIYGVAVGSLSMTTFASLGCLMAGILAAQTLQGGGRRSRASLPPVFQTIPALPPARP